MDHTGSLEEFEWIGARLLTIPNTQHHRIRSQPRIGCSATFARMLIDGSRQIDRFKFVVHRESDSLREALLPKAPVSHQRRLGLKSHSFLGTLKRKTRKAGIEGAVRTLDHHNSVAPAVESIWAAACSKSAREASIGVVHEKAPAIVENAMSIEEEPQGNRTVVDVTVGRNLHPAKQAIVRTQVGLAAVCFDEAV